MPATNRPSLAWTHPLHRGIPPPWASEWGEDRLHGPWCAFEFGEVVQRLRWISPGAFRMGSPKDEEGRFAWEGPRQLVSIDSGFWMFDTPCTQALWEAVIGENPSHFDVAERSKNGADRPVDSVSWDQCQEFLTALNTRLDGLQLSLPSEAQWEYACRAGTETARYAETLDAIAWYRENSGRETHPVASKEANSWGLYDMLGNVWEWCADVWQDDYSEQGRRIVGRIGVSPPRDPGRLVGWRRAGCVRGLPQPQRAFVPVHQPGLPLCRVQAGVVIRGRQGSEAAGAEHPGASDPARARALGQVPSCAISGPERTRLCRRAQETLLVVVHLLSQRLH